jgi:hypothetical protein
METPEFPPPALAEVRPDDDDRAMVLSRLQLLHDTSQSHLAQWATRVLPKHDLDVRARGEAAATELRRLARFANRLAAHLAVEIEAYDAQQDAILASVQHDTAGGVR